MLAEILNEESGQGLVEYTFIIMLIALACVVGFKTIGVIASDRADYVTAQFP